MPFKYSTALYSVPVVLTDASTISTNAALSNHFRVTLAGSRTLANPTNSSDGQVVTWEFIQDSTGSRTITLGSAFNKGSLTITLTTTATKRDFMQCIYNATTSLWYVILFAKGY
jgi:hypothetical protein